MLQKMKRSTKSKSKSVDVTATMIEPSSSTLSASTVIMDDQPMINGGDDFLPNQITTYPSTRWKCKRAKMTKITSIPRSPSTSSVSNVIMADQKMTIDDDNGDSDSGSSTEFDGEPEPSENNDVEIKSQSTLNSGKISNLDGISDLYFMPIAKKPDKFLARFKPQITQIRETDFIHLVQNEFEQVNFDLEPDMSIYFALLMEDINIMFHGFGSKISILEHFANTQLKDRLSYLTINGYKPDPVLKDIVDCFKQTIEDTDNNKVTDPDELIEVVRNKFRTIDLVVIIHSIDMLIQDRKNLIKPFLLRLFSPGARIHLVASSDHVNFPLQWSSQDIGLLQLHIVLKNTALPYLKEREANNQRVWPSFTEESDKKIVGYDSIHLVYESSNETSQKIFLIILDQFLKTPKKSILKFSDFKESLQNTFGSREDAYYKVQLIEFTSHGLLRFKNQDVGEMIQFNIDRNDAQRFLDVHRDKHEDIF